MVDRNGQTKRIIRYSGYISASAGVIVVIMGAGMAFTSETSEILALQAAMIILGGTGLALDGLFQVRDPSPPESERERSIALLKILLFLGLIFAGSYLPQLL